MGLFQKLKQGLARTSNNIRSKIQSIFQPGALTDEFLDELEAVLIQADVGVEATTALIDSLREESRGKSFETVEDLYRTMAEEVAGIFASIDAPLKVAGQGPTVYTMVGVNGSGKTTTIAKLAHRYTSQNKKVVLAAADTFRAAAGDQLEVWAKRTGADLVRHSHGSDPGAVAFDAARAAIARKADLLLVDTAGRLHTKKNLMEELKKVIRVISREIPGAPHEVILVIDGTTGQNGLIQARVFARAVDITGLCITKLDGSSKGGIAVAIASELGIPVKLVGVGEQASDLRDFDARGFAHSLFGIDQVEC
ncbi:MAG: signal recognition particle-docking protein FtsY [Bacillota bacterium]|jgi:fused signal recognition particle receptor|nr:signal recognition particle-docking protein FtsY [Candidatus Fermentithermobacillaceae bacterium]